MNKIDSYARGFEINSFEDEKSEDDIEMQNVNDDAKGLLNPQNNV